MSESAFKPLAHDKTFQISSTDQSIKTFGKCILNRRVGSGGGTSGRAMAFCPSKPGSNPRMDLAFFGNAIYSHWPSGYL